MRRLPVYLLIDTSGSMRGEPIEAVNVGLQTLLATLRQDPHALESVWISVITFDREVTQLMPLTPLDSLRIPEITTPDSGPTHTGEALEMLCRTVDREVLRGTPDQKGDWMPLLFLMTDGKPSDLPRFREAIPQLQKRQFANIIACAAGPKAENSYMKEITDHVVHLDTTDRATFQKFFKWVSETIGVGNRSMGAVGAESLLPPPPPEIHMVV